MDKFGEYLFYYKRYIDDIYAIWLAHPDPDTNSKLLKEFSDCLNDFHGLEWTVTPPSRRDVVFMDMSLSISDDGRIESTIYAKKLATYLYIPPSSAHAPGVHTSLIMGNVLRIMQLCTNKADIDNKLEEFVDRLLDRGHQLSSLLPLFEKAIENATLYIAKSEDEKRAAKDLKAQQAARSVYLHVPYRPDNPQGKIIQGLWDKHVANPPGELPLNQMENLDEELVPVDKLVLCYHREPNLSNLLSYRKIGKRLGPKASSFLYRIRSWRAPFIFQAAALRGSATQLEK